MEMMELIERISTGEDSYTQFKRELIKAKELAKEMVAFANSEGGIIIFGVDDNGNIVGLSSKEIEALGQLVGNIANENVRPPIHPLTQNFSIEDKMVTVVTITKGRNRPYATSSGDYYVKSGPDKKKMSQEELRRLFAESKNLFADEEVILDSDISDLNSELFYAFLEKDDTIVYSELKNGQLALSKVLENKELLQDDHLTLAGNLIFGINPQKFTPSFYIDCVYFDGNDVSVGKFISKKVVKGSFSRMFDDSLNFIVSNLPSKQVEGEFNSLGKLEIDKQILIELLVNALVHRDYYINSSIKVFMFYNRVEIVSPGKLTNSLTVEKIKNGISIHRNPILNSICKSVLPYSGYGSGIKRVLKIDPTVKFKNDIDKEEFKATIYR